MKFIVKYYLCLAILSLGLVTITRVPSFGQKSNYKGSSKSASKVDNQFIETAEGKLAYRKIGKKGIPIILCNRFRGNMDSWDPAFLDALAEKYQVLIFDYSGFGLSTGPAPMDMKSFSKDIYTLSSALGFNEFVLGGWSFGGMVAQVFIADHPELVSQGILIGTGPPGQNNVPMEPIFFERSSILYNSLDDETVLFFEPNWEPSRIAAIKSHERIAERTHDQDILIPQSLWGNYHKAYEGYVLDKEGIRQKILTSEVPMLVVTGDHDISFPLQNWYALARKLQTTQLIVIPMAGHGPHHEYPELISTYIDSFLAHIQKSM